MKTSNPIVSVVIPMYNVERYIEKSVQSVLAQTYTNFEIVCVDDGCSDGTLERLQQFSDSRIRIVRQENAGLAAARNTGINAAQGIYIALLDADDFWAPLKLELHVRHLESNPEVGVSYCPSLFVDEEDAPLGIGQFPKLFDIGAQDVLCRNPVGNGSAPVIRRSVLVEIGKIELEQHRFRMSYFDPTFRQSEDIECWLRIALDTRWRFEGIKQPLTYYRVNAGGLSANIEKQYQSWQRAIEKNQVGHEAFFKKWYSLAQAYQERYLARRAVQSGDSAKALLKIHGALLRDIRILTHDPVRTLVTYGCCLLSVLPNWVYSRLQGAGMLLLGRYRIS